MEIVLVTGGTGFVAGWCVVDLLRRGYAVRTTVRNLSKAEAVRAAIATAGQSDDNLTVVAADLTHDEGWDVAMAGCDYVLHVASPLGGGAARDEALIAPARDGTRRVLRAATAAGVKRVVMTSAAATARPRLGSGTVSDETIWADPSDPQFDAYRRSKILAERGAWDFMGGHRGATTLTTILPGAVFGPVLSGDNLGSVRIIQQLLEGRPSGLPRLEFNIVDVRDLADLHIRAMTAPQAAGQRFLAIGEAMWMADIAGALRARLGARASKVPTRDLPDIAVRLLALLVPHLRMLTPVLGRRNPVSSDKARRMLGFSPRPAAETVTDCAESLLVRP
ncbi:nucleoside-diphosphate-sugar epimerase [Caulobacter sp. AP07]|uniref:NAD-dependent epimerase/dehydratase family protein n=1 Tax=Caulobacter sp. AP07 TaxID=1144304 RepID=UPI000271DA3C|nr:NAD-dependent epimerase/dehydratase family protein [Caulobacter sp. AP07]EJL26747.1 nucleoside-diphosphate-sugar epimerase [Caulobacter sp. AP07]